MDIELLQGDLTKVEVDAIVNAANTSLLGGGGVDGAIHRAGGPAILAACEQIRVRQGGCEVGEAVITTAGNLPSKFVIHTVGPIWQGGRKGEPELLHNAYTNSLRLAEEHALQSIAFPNISTGIYGYPKEQAAHIALEAAQAFKARAQHLQRLIFVCFDDENYRLYQQTLAQ